MKQSGSKNSCGALVENHCPKSSSPHPRPTPTALPPFPSHQHAARRIPWAGIKHTHAPRPTELSGGIHMYQHSSPQPLPPPWQQLHPYLGIKLVSFLPAHGLKLVLRPGEEPAVGRTRGRLAKCTVGHPLPLGRGCQGAFIPSTLSQARC